jgi:hypothetical protein
MKNNLIEMAYTSRATALLDDQELVSILKQARKFNTTHHITGVLLYKDGSFFQAFEGESDILLRLMNSIQRDARHVDIRLLYQKPLASRNFSDWAMAFHNFSHFESDGVTEKPTIQDGFLSLDCPQEEFDSWAKPSVAKLLAEAFRLHA